MPAGPNLSRPVSDRIGVFGGSNAQDYMEVDWGCPLRLCLQYRGEDAHLKHEITGDMQRGNFGEEPAARWYSIKSGVIVRKSHRTFYHKNFRFLMAHVDRLAADRTIIEIKCPSRYSFARVKRDGLPEGWILQGQHYLMVTWYKRVRYVIHSFDPWEQLVLEVESDAEIQKIMLERAVNLQARAENGPLPDPLSPDDKRCARCVFRARCHGSLVVGGQIGGVENGSIAEDDSLRVPLDTYLDAKRTAEQAQEIAEAAKDELVAALKDRDAVSCGQHRIFYRTVQSFRWDTKSLETAHPELVKDFKRESISRPLRVTEITNGN